MGSRTGMYKKDRKMNHFLKKIAIAGALTAVAASAANLPTVAPKEINATTAFLLSWLLGEFGVHRHYLGTKPIMWLIYTITGGGLGVVWGVDTILLFLDLLKVGEGYLQKYVNNEKFIVWL